MIDTVICYFNLCIFITHYGGIRTILQAFFAHLNLSIGIFAYFFRPRETVFGWRYGETVFGAQAFQRMK